MCLTPFLRRKKVSDTNATSGPAACQAADSSRSTEALQQTIATELASKRGRDTTQEECPALFLRIHSAVFEGPSSGVNETTSTPPPPLAPAWRNVNVQEG